MDSTPNFKPGDLVNVRNREWVVLPETRENLLRLRPLGGAESDASLIYVPLEAEQPKQATFSLPDANFPGSRDSVLLLRDALRLKLRAGAGPFRSFGNLNFDPRAYQLVPLLMALKLDPVRLLIADDVGIGKTIEAGLIVRELLDRGEIQQFVVICPPHLCEQWQSELAEKFDIDAVVVRTGTATRLERELHPDESLFEVHDFIVVSLDYIKSDRRRNDFLRSCPDFVIVDEAHTCVESNSNTRHQRYRLLKQLAEKDPKRSMVLLTATPHSGNDIAFHNLLGLLEPKFAELVEMSEGDEWQKMREELANHFVQRRRGDIEEWKDSTNFPIRESREVTYRITGKWGKLFDNVLDYARTMVSRAEGGSKQEQRMSWWSALALLRCASSSPAAASLTLRTRLQKAEGSNEEERISNLDSAASETVLDWESDDLLSLTDSVPAGTIDEVDDVDELGKLVKLAENLRGARNDPKLNTLIQEVKNLVEEKYRPVVFCRYIATAHYVGDELKATLSNDSQVVVITGELTPDQREESVESLPKQDSPTIPVLVATDCLSEGVNLQDHFNAVIHYDLTWNPTRHEQREGRADRFGQNSNVVRTLMLYGENNPVDGAVLRVILRKAEKIRKELGISVPLPSDNNKVIDAIMNEVLLHSESLSKAVQTELDLGGIEAEVESEWEAAKNKVTRTVFSQRRLRPQDVLPEWEKIVSILGDSEDVFRFVDLSTKILKAQIDLRNGIYRLPFAHLPKPLQDRLDASGFNSHAKLAFSHSAPTGAEYIHRVHPLITTLADYIAERALSTSTPDVANRTGAMFTNGVNSRVVIYLLRLRYQIQVKERNFRGELSLAKCLLAEECLEVAVSDNTTQILKPDDARNLLSLNPDRNMSDGQKTDHIQKAIYALPQLKSEFERIAHDQAKKLLDDHRRVRDASEAKGIQYEVVPALPVDKIGAFVLVPIAGS